MIKHTRQNSEGNSRGRNSLTTKIVRKETLCICDNTEYYKNVDSLLYTVG